MTQKCRKRTTIITFKVITFKVVTPQMRIAKTVSWSNCAEIINNGTIEYGLVLAVQNLKETPINRSILRLQAELTLSVTGEDEKLRDLLN